MKSFILCFFVLATLVVSIHSFTDDHLNNMDQILKLAAIMTECHQQTVKATGQKLTDLRNNPTLKKYLGCTAGRIGVIKDNGEFNKKILRRVLKLTTNNKDKVDGIIQACAINKSSKEETAYSFLECLLGLMH